MADATPPPALDFRNTNALWSSVLVETLARAGVTQAVISPGSRSTALTVALARHPRIEALPVLDERSAAFFALGLAKQQMRPVLLVCTSGTAGANYFPAIIEARETGVPLLVITADRPPEMRACASGQTIDQQKLFGAYVSFYHELALPEANLELLRYLRQTIRHAIRATQQPFGGPVHVNAPFRDPLAPVTDESAASLEHGADWATFFAGVDAARGPSSGAGHHAFPSEASLPFRPDQRGLIVAGPRASADPEAYVEAVGEIARRLGWPVLADGLSALRHHAHRIPGIVAAYDTILRNPAVAEGLKPDFVLALGPWPTSKVLRSWLAAADVPAWLVSAHPENRDALHVRSRQVAVDLRAFAAQLPAASGSKTNAYEKSWAGFEQRARTAIEAQLGRSDPAFEGRCAWALGQHLPRGTAVIVANSMPVRDVEYFWPANDRGTRVFVNRGGNGIDGTLSSAVGVAHGNGARAVLLTGDLALLHDSNGFLLRSKLRGSLTIVLINNRGGGIFNHLPIAQFEPPFEEYFATPQDIDFATLCRAHGVEHTLVRDPAHFSTLVSELPATGMRVFEVRTDRKADAATRKRIFAEVAAGLEPG